MKTTIIFSALVVLAGAATVAEALPGKGLAQHDFLDSGEFDTRNTNQTMFLVKGGKVVWTCQIPIKDAKSIHGQFRNVRMTKAGTYLLAHMNLGKVIEYDN